MQKLRFFRTMSAALLLCFFSEICTPVLLLALTGGPTQVDFQGSPGSSNMVDLFTGEFNYNLPLLTVPGPDGSSYPVTLAYQGNFSPEDDASWVGLGWSLNPGAIIRNKNGFADDWHGAHTTYYNRIDPAVTYTSGQYAAGEAFDVSVGVTPYTRFNSHKGWSYGTGFFSSLFGIGNLNLNIDEEQGTSFSASVSPMAMMKLSKTWAPQPVLRPTNSFHYEGKIETFSEGVQLTGSLLVGPSVGRNGSRAEIKPANEGEEVIKCFGYMYSADAKPRDMMDYIVEKEKSFLTKDNKFLSIPFSAPDYFIATGEGVNGSFRLHQSRVGLFGPNRQTSTIQINNSVEQWVIPTNAAGALGYSGQTTLEGESSFITELWNPGNPYYFNGEGAKDRSTDHDSEPYYFRFNNDLGGSKVYFDGNDKPTQAWSSGTYDSRLLPPVMNYGQRHQRNTYIGYRTIHDVKESQTYGVPYRAYNKENSTRNMVSKDGVTYSATDEKKLLAHTIGEFAITGSNGGKYVYGLPVYSRNEYNLSFEVDNQSAIANNYTVNDAENVTTSSRNVVGDYQNSPYASMFLLTEVTTPDYYDVNNNGPDPQDIGGYTKFNYERSYGEDDKLASSSNWYKWRMPYRGFRYSRHSFSDPRDDRATVRYGEKEVYYLQSIETKTHVAVFVTNMTNMPIGGVQFEGSGEKRLDAFGANPDEAQAAGGSASYPAAGTDNNMRYLEEIHLYAKDEQGNPAKLLKKVKFGYDYSLMQGTISSAPVSGGGDRHGKLTLRFIWVESEGVVNATTSPYEFTYEYPSSSDYPSAYSGLAITGLTSEDQNPRYDSANIDRWGKYQKGGLLRYDDYIDWVNQNPSSSFDPAAWHLKKIKLPTGGEIHVQYEQHDYQYIQDRPAMAMVALKSTSIDSDEDEPNKYYLDLEGTFGNDGGEAALKDLIGKYFIRGTPHREKMYFKFLYNLDPSESGPCNQEYIRGYSGVTECNIDDGGLFVRLGEQLEIPLFTLKLRPIDAAYGFKRTHFQTMIDKADCSIDYPFQPFGRTEDLEDILDIMDAAAPEDFPDNDNITRPVLQKTQSYLRVPVYKPKQGGGVRVKHLLFLNPENSLETGDNTLYGYQYLYETFETGLAGEEERRISSGVASNEPLMAREENALVRLINENDPEVINTIVAGDRLIQYEGPLGESLLPTPSIGYSNVIVRNICTEVTKPNPGFVHYDFFTTKDLPPVKIEMTEVDKHPVRSSPIMDILQQSEERIYATQGYTFTRTRMNGVVRSVYNYGGDYHIEKNSRSDAFEGAILVGSTKHKYYKPGEEVPVMHAPDRPLRMRSPGKQTEVLMEGRRITDHVSNTPLHYSVGIHAAFPFIIGSVFPYMYNKLDQLNLHVTTKIIDCPVLLKSTESYHEGVVSTVTNDVFDAVTGSPVVQHTTDGYDELDLEQSSGHDGSYHTFTIPAHMVYDNMGQRSKAEQFVLDNTDDMPQNWSMPNIEISVTSGTQIDPGRGATPAGSCTFRFVSSANITSGSLSAQTLIARYRLMELIKTIGPGDLVELKNKNRVAQGLFHLGAITASTIDDPGSNPSVTFELFDPEFGSATHLHEISIRDIKYLEVIRSGRDNNLGQSAGSFTVYGSKDIVEEAIAYAKVLRNREHYALRFNHWIYGGFSSSTKKETELGRGSLLNDHTLTWEPVNPTTMSVPFDLVNEYSIPFNDPPDDINTLSCNDFVASYPYYYCRTSTLGLRIPESKFVLRFTKTPIAAGEEILKLGWWDEANDVWVVNPESSSGEECYQEFRYTYTETFGINDDGHLVYNANPVYDKYSLPNNGDRNINFDFRNYNGPTTATLSVDAERVNAFPDDLFNKVLQASAQVFDERWPNTDAATEPLNNYEIGRLGVWRPLTGFVYRTDEIIDGAYDEASPGLEQRTYTDAGTFDLPSFFDHTNPTTTANPGWRQLGAVEKYTATGIPLQAHNILGITSATVFSHRNFLPAFSAFNATTGQLSFESFEDKTTGVTTGIAHTGRQSREVNGSRMYTTATVTMIGPMAARFWVRNSIVDNDVSVVATSALVSGTLGVEVLIGGSAVHSSNFEVKRIARTGEWVLYEVPVYATALGGSPSGTLSLRFSMYGLDFTAYYIDDIRIQPLHAIGVTSVYERNTLRPLAVLDDNHFALIYQYDAEGKPIRTIKETIRGYKTLSEGIGNLPRRVVVADLEQTGHILTEEVRSSLHQPSSPSIDRGAHFNSSDPAKAGGKMNLLDIHITPDNKSMKLFDQNPEDLKIPDVKQFKTPAPDSLEISPTVPQTDAFRKYKPSSVADSTLRKKLPDGQKELQQRTQGKEAVDPTIKTKLPAAYQNAIDSVNSRRFSTGKQK